MAEFSDYVAVLEPELEFFDKALALADKVGGTLGLAKGGRLVITLPADKNAIEVAADLTNDDFGACYVLPGTDSHLVFDL